MAQRWLKADRPLVRIIPTGAHPEVHPALELARLYELNSKTGYFVTTWAVGQMAVDAERVQFVADIPTDVMHTMLFEPYGVGEDRLIRMPRDESDDMRELLAEWHRRDHEAFLALPPWERAPETWMN